MIPRSEEASEMTFYDCDQPPAPPNATGAMKYTLGFPGRYLNQPSAGYHGQRTTDKGLMR
jgi:hypothetical protein